jgi:hypothetical protein
MGKKEAVDEECDEESVEDLDKDEFESEEDEFDEDMLSLEGEEVFEKNRFAQMSEDELNEEYDDTEEEPNSDNQR